MPNEGYIYLPIYIWIGLGFLFSIFITIIAYFLKKTLDSNKENDDILFERDREKEKQIADHETRITVLEKK